MDTSALPFSKGKSRARLKARRDRDESAIKRSVRAEVVERDGYCRLADTWTFGRCGGASEWAHWGQSKRCKTRGLPPEVRHTSFGTLMLCRLHHQGPQGYDSHGFEIEAMTAHGADGPLRFSRGDVVEIR